MGEEEGKEEEREKRQSGERILKFSLRKMSLVFFFFFKCSMVQT